MAHTKCAKSSFAWLFHTNSYTDKILLCPKVFFNLLSHLLQRQCASPLSAGEASRFYNSELSDRRQWVDSLIHTHHHPTHPPPPPHTHTQIRTTYSPQLPGWGMPVPVESSRLSTDRRVCGQSRPPLTCTQQLLPACKTRILCPSSLPVSALKLPLCNNMNWSKLKDFSEFIFQLLSSVILLPGGVFGSLFEERDL